ISGIGISSRIGALPYSCMRAALMYPFVLATGASSRTVVLPDSCMRAIYPFLSTWWMTECGDSRFCHRDVLFNRAGTCSNRTDNGSVQNDGHSAAEDDDLSGVGLLNAEERPSRLREAREV